MAKIMIADDAKFVRLRVNRLLTELGHEVVEVENGNEAVQTYPVVKPDAVLMDITMPDKDGLTALAEIRALDPQATVIMLTALSQQGLMLEAMKAGATDFVVKPYEADRLTRVLQKALA